MTISITLDATGIALALTFVCLVAADRVERRRLARHQPMSRLTIAFDVGAVAAGLGAVLLSGFTPWVVVFAIGVAGLMVVNYKVAVR